MPSMRPTEDFLATSLPNNNNIYFDLKYIERVNLLALTEPWSMKTIPQTVHHIELLQYQL